MTVICNEYIVISQQNMPSHEPTKENIIVGYRYRNRSLNSTSRVKGICPIDSSYTIFFIKKIGDPKFKILFWRDLDQLFFLHFLSSKITGQGWRTRPYTNHKQTIHNSWNNPLIRTTRCRNLKDSTGFALDHCDAIVLSVNQSVASSSSSDQSQDVYGLCMVCEWS